MEFGHAKASSSGFGGRGLEQIDKEREKMLRVQKHTFGEDEDDEVVEDEENIQQQAENVLKKLPSHTSSSPSASSLPPAVPKGVAHSPHENGIAADGAAGASVPVAVPTEPSSDKGQPPPKKVAISTKSASFKAADIAKKIASRIVRDLNSFLFAE